MKGALFFASPASVGKTFVAKKLAKFLFATEEAFLRFDMSEFKEEHTVSKFIGSPPGYVGYEQGGMLTNAVRQKPFSVILFYEIEKAHPRIMDIFLQILDDRRLTDSRGQTVFFTETVIIFTSNIGTRTTDSRGAPIREREELEAIINDVNLDHEGKKWRIRKHFTRAVEHFFIFKISHPELLNRIGNKSVSRWLAERYGEQMTMFGDRGITNAIENGVMIPLVKAVLRAEHNGERGIRFLLTVTDQCIVVK
ncbi:MAG: AAA family ATPase [Armatimonadota bacterium]|nr:AAA family ATPase [Armatimonadota bacterium]MDW8026503.1 AAA family ATPase [Armatimonadota bacterium]